MSDSFVNPIFGDRARTLAEVAPDVPPDVAPAVEVEGTGEPEVDAVVASLGGLDDLPVGDHVEVFEQAHETLRRTLAGAGQESPAAGRS
ncbi:MAG: hypothetical protein ABIR34_07680 [Marmoricola sp.]